MTNHDTTKQHIETILHDAFTPTSLEVVDDSAAHRGHKEAEGGGHFTVIMRTKLFDGVNQVKRHRMVYEKLGHLMTNDIHALSLHLYGSEE